MPYSKNNNKEFPMKNLYGFSKVFFLFIFIVELTLLTACRKEKLYSNAEPVTDIDGNTYRTIMIGTQTWMQTNLKTTRLNDGTSIPTANDGKSWYDLKTPGYVNWTNRAFFYNGYCVQNINLCPVGWHVPTSYDISILVKYLGGETVAGGKMKSVSSLWDYPTTNNVGASNSSGFTAEPYGSTVYPPFTGGWWFDGSGHFASFRGTDISLFLNLESASVSLNYGPSLNTGYNVRCLKD
jgi:uncharacterized protein (TIGR02145 family)